MKPHIAMVLCLVLCFSIVRAFAQKPVDPIKLSPQASQVWQNIDKAEAEIRKEYLDKHAQLEDKRAILLIGAQVSEGWKCAAGADGIVVCSKPPEPKPTPKAP